MRLIVKQTTDRLAGQIVVPRSKYHVHRALMLASLARGVSRVVGSSDAGQVRSTVAALRALGTRVEVRDDDFVVLGGAYRPEQPEVPVGRSGATLYVLTGLASLAVAPVTIVGQHCLPWRSIRPLLTALAELGVRLSTAADGRSITIRPHRPNGGTVRMPGAASGWISGLLMLAPFATGPTVITVDGELNGSSRVALTVRMMREFGLEVGVSADGRQFSVEPNQQATPSTVVMPPDVGAAAFGVAAAALHPADVLFHGLPSAEPAQLDHPEADLLRIVADMGVPMTADPDTGTVRVRHDGVALVPTRVDCRALPDVLPVLSVLGTVAKGTTTFDNVGHARRKEPDRVSAMSQLNQMGARLELRGDQLHCSGVDVLTGADLSSSNDNRVLMSLAVAGTVAQGETSLTFPNAHRVSYPGFLDDMRAVGLKMALAKGSYGPAGTKPDFPARSGEAALLTRSGSQPTALAVDGPDARRTMSWHELDDQVDRVVTMLQRLGVRRGESVAFQLPDQARFVALAMAIARIGATACPVMPTWRQRETTAGLLRTSRARVLVVPAKSAGRDHTAEAAELVIAEPSLALQYVLVISGGSPAPTSQLPDRDAPALTVVRLRRPR